MKSDQFTEENLVALISPIWAKSFELSVKDMQARIPPIRHVAQKILE